MFFVVNIALLLASGGNPLLHMLLPSARIDAYGGRVGFLAGGLPGLVSFFLRRALTGIDEYTCELSAHDREPLRPLLGANAWPGRAPLSATRP